MIYWKDFILDDICGPLLVEDLVRETSVKVCRGKRIGSSNVMEDVAGEKAVQIQETGQEQRPARMVGHSDLESLSPTGMEAGLSSRSSLSRQGEEA